LKGNFPLVSIIIPTYNRADQLRICLNSVVNQTFKDFEVIVCDDGSTDHTHDVIKDFENVLLIKYIKDVNFGGPARPRNNGIKIAKGEIIAFLDSDDWWYENKLEVSLLNIERYDIVYHNLDKYKTINNSNGIIKGRSLQQDITKDLIVNGNGIPNSSVLIKRKIIDLVGIISEDKNLIAVEDSDYWIRVSQVTNKFNFINQSLGAYWMGGNISLSEKQFLREEALFEKYKHLLNIEERLDSLKLLSFKKARVLHKIGNFKEARNCYYIAIQMKSNSFKIKSFWGIIFTFFTFKI